MRCLRNSGRCLLYRVEVSARASRDLRAIAAFIQASSGQQAMVWFHGLELAMRSLEEMPLRGPLLAEYPTYRQLLYGTRPHVYRIIYTVEEGRQLVSIAHVRHGARERPALS